MLGVGEGGDDGGYSCGKAAGSVDRRSLGQTARVGLLQGVMDDTRSITGVVWVFSAMFGFLNAGTIKVEC